MKKRLTFKPHLTIIITTTTITIVIITIVIIALVKITKITKITIIIQIFKFINLHVAITVVCQIGTKTAHQPKKTWNGDLLFNHFDELIAYRGPPPGKALILLFYLRGSTYVHLAIYLYLKKKKTIEIFNATLANL